MTEKKTIAIFGAGSGLGASLANRFGREGYRVALVARRAGPLDERVAELARAGIEGSAFPADLTNLEGIPELVRSIQERLGSIDVAVYCPVPSDVGFVPAVDLDASKLQSMAPIFTFAPIEVSHAVLPGMLARGDGAVVTHCRSDDRWDERCRPVDGGRAQLHLHAQCRGGAQRRLRRYGQHRRGH